jgi:hypothetical protein
MTEDEKHEQLLHRVIGMRDQQIRDLESRISELELLLREAIEIIEGTGLDASPQRAAIAKATGQEV